MRLLYKLLWLWRLKTKKNFGYLGGFKKKEFKVGDVWEVLQPSGQWDLYLPEYEYQRFSWGDTMACVTFSFLNCLETLLKRKYNEQWDFSDRFTAKVSGTTKNGNWMYKVASSWNMDGFLSFLHWRNEGLTWDEFYKEIPQEKKALAFANRKHFELGYDWIDPITTAKLKEALEYSPLWIAICAYGHKVNGVYQRTDGSINHCVMLYGYDERGWKIYDHYLGNEYRILAPDYIIGTACRLKITKTYGKLN